VNDCQGEFKNNNVDGREQSTATTTSSITSLLLLIFPGHTVSVSASLEHHFLFLEASELKL
jgi:hypothetical protein